MSPVATQIIFKGNKAFVLLERNLEDLLEVAKKQGARFISGTARQNHYRDAVLCLLGGENCGLGLDALVAKAIRR